ncbi:MAG TPA: MarR family transcriptional regulator [Acidimicrobiales bacterium]|nr:MarR family transcriptional regulator [Acidimicrobiales bacterium]
MAPPAPGALDDLLAEGQERITAYGMLLEARASLVSAVADELEATSGLSPAWFEVLVRLARSPGKQMRMSELAAQVLFSTSGLTRLIDRMEHAALVRRESCPDDRRGAFAVLTDDGLAALERALPAHLESLDRHLVDPLGARGLATLTALLERLRDATRSADPADA